MRTSIEIRANIHACLSCVPRINASKDSIGGILTYAVIFRVEKISKPGVFQQPARIQNGNLQDTASYLQNLYDASQAQELRDGLAAVDFRTQLPEEFLFMTDRFSMAHSLEARVPFLDHRLVEKVFRISAPMRTKGTDLKYLLKRAVSDLLPPDLLTAPKRGFVIPLELWLRRELRPLVERLLDPRRLHD